MHELLYILKLDYTEKKSIYLMSEMHEILHNLGDNKNVLSEIT